MRSSLPVRVFMAAVSVATVLLVASTLQRPAVPTFPLSGIEAADSNIEAGDSAIEGADSTIGAAEVGDGLVGPRVVTLDVSDPDRWVFFDFSRGTVVDGGRGLDWDLAFRRPEVLINGGDGFPGRGGVVDLGEVPFEEVDVVPETGYEGTLATRDSVQPLLADWYDYSFTSHLLTPKPRVWALRTADGRYAKLRFLGYYCPGPTPGCMTFEYVYQGSGERSFRVSAGS